MDSDESHLCGESLLFLPFRLRMCVVKQEWGLRSNQTLDPLTVSHSAPENWILREQLSTFKLTILTVWGHWRGGGGGVLVSWPLMLRQTENQVVFYFTYNIFLLFAAELRHNQCLQTRRWIYSYYLCVSDPKTSHAIINPPRSNDKKEMLEWMMMFLKQDRDSEALKEQSLLPFLHPSLPQ